jgi:uncharacterized membrane protein
MNTKFWADIHGGTTHFPIALLIASFVFDAVAYAVNRDPVRRDLHAASFYALLLGALGSFAAVLSGLIISRWEVFGGGQLGLHHRYVWPAFALIVGLAVWRLTVRERASRPAFGVYLVVTLLAAVAMAAAGYWGGEMLQGGG